MKPINTDGENLLYDFAVNATWYRNQCGGLHPGMEVKLGDRALQGYMASLKSIATTFAALAATAKKLRIPERIVNKNDEL